MENLTNTAVHLLEDSQGADLTRREKRKLSVEITTAMIALVCLVTGLLYKGIFPEQTAVAGLIYSVGVLVEGLPLLATAIRGFLQRDVTNAMEILVSIAVLACYITGQHELAILIPVVLSVVHFLEERSIMGGRDAIEGLKQMQATDAVLETEDGEVTVEVQALKRGDIIIVRPGMGLPIDGTVNDPYPFKVLIGPDNLTANGIDIPDVAGAVVSGTASGDWTLSCVRGQIRSVTFVFQDGTIRTVPEDGGRGQSTNQTGGTGNSTTQGGLGWISDPYGIPCVSGERRSNAQQYLGSQALITAAGAGAASLIQSDNGSMAVVANSNGSLGTVGISGNEAMGRILAGGVRDMADWVNKLYGQAFAAIYVPPSARVAVHLEHPLNIDNDAKGRRVNHRPGGNHASDLD